MRFFPLPWAISLLHGSLEPYKPTKYFLNLEVWGGKSILEVLNHFVLPFLKKMSS